MIACKVGGGEGGQYYGWPAFIVCAPPYLHGHGPIQAIHHGSYDPGRLEVGVGNVEAEVGTPQADSHLHVRLEATPLQPLEHVPAGSSRQ